ncbi:unnamed protein product, partial [Discosporangium mesarthrocarpum]
MYQPPIVNFPVFSVAWASETDDKGNTTPAIAAVGGGGAGKTGVGNKISLIGFDGATGGRPSHNIEFELETSPHTSNFVTVDDSGQLLAAAFGRNAHIYASGPSGLVLLAEFKVDEAEKESGINSMAFASPLLGGRGQSKSEGTRWLLATGGEDGVMRVWVLSTGNGSECAPRKGGGSNANRQEKMDSLKAALVGECRGHLKPITCLRFHPCRDIILTSSKDGTSRLGAWDWQQGREVALLPATVGLPPSVSAGSVMCRSCCFSPDGERAFTAQSAPRGKAYVTEWSFGLSEGEGEGPGRGRRC